jgi:hypothetical protein
MTFSPERGYHGPRSQQRANNQLDGKAAVHLLEPVGDQETTDLRLTPAERRFVRDLLAELCERLSVDGLMFLAGASEDAAQRKRAKEEGRPA